MSIKEKVLVTGVGGFIASKVAHLLLDQGYDVIGLDNMNAYYDVKLKEFRLSELKKREGFRSYIIDIEDKADLEKIFSEHIFTKVFNLAARAGVRYSMENPDVYVSTNIQGNLNLLNCCKKYDIKKYVLASTSSLYAGKEMPFLESLDVSEPISPYAATKKGAEAMCYTYSYLYGIDCTIVRYFTVYGELSRPDMAQLRFMKWIENEEEIELFGDGSQARDFTHVDDIARGTVLAGEKNLGYEIINLGGGENPISVNEMISMLETELGKKAKVNNLPFNKSDMKVTWANIEKAQKLLGWKPEISFSDGIKRCVAHYKENYELYQGIKL